MQAGPSTVFGAQAASVALGGPTKANRGAHLRRPLSGFRLPLYTKQRRVQSEAKEDGAAAKKSGISDVVTCGTE